MMKNFSFFKRSNRKYIKIFKLLRSQKFYYLMLSFFVGVISFQNCSAYRFVPVEDPSLGAAGGPEEPVIISRVNFSLSMSSFGTGQCAILVDESVKCWGGNTNGELGNPLPEYVEGSPKPVLVHGLLSNSGATSISSGLFYTCAVIQGEVLCWGANSSGQLGDGTVNNRFTPFKVPLLDVKDVKAGPGGAHTCALKKTGEVFCWGDNSTNQLGNGTHESSLVPMQVSELASISQLSSGMYNSCALDSDSKVWCWGSNTFHILDATSKSYLIPVEMKLLSHTASVKVGAFHVCALNKSGQVHCWGENDLSTGVLGVSPVSVQNSHVPILVAGLPEVLSLGVGSGHNCALTIVGEVFCWGENQEGQLGNGTTDDSFTPVKALFPAGKKVVAMAVGQVENCALTDDNTVWCWGLGFETIPQLNKNL